MRKPLQYHISTQARLDIIELATYLLTFGVDKRDSWLCDLQAMFTSLGQFPKQGKEDPDFGKSCRRLVMKKTLIIYRIKRTESEIVRVIDGRRDTSRLKPPVK